MFLTELAVLGFILTLTTVADASIHAEVKARFVSWIRSFKYLAFRRRLDELYEIFVAGFAQLYGAKQESSDQDSQNIVWLVGVYSIFLSCSLLV